MASKRRRRKGGGGHHKRRRRKNPSFQAMAATTHAQARHRRKRGRPRRASRTWQGHHHRWGRVRGHHRRVNPEAIVKTVLHGALGAVIGAGLMIGGKMAAGKVAPTLTDQTTSLIGVGAGAIGGALIAAKKSPTVGLAAVGASLAIPAVAQLGKLAAQLGPAPVQTAKATQALFDVGSGRKYYPGQLQALFDPLTGRRSLTPQLQGVDDRSALAATGYKALLRM
jgi:hypothetical protein